VSTRASNIIGDGKIKERRKEVFLKDTEMYKPNEDIKTKEKENKNRI
jgi:hypothetical protein